MKTYTILRNETAGLCNVSTSDTNAMAKIDSFLNDSIRTICNLNGGQLRFLEATKEMTTVADQEGYQIPNGFRKLMDLFITVPGTSSSDPIYMPEMVFDPKRWKLIKAWRLGTSDVARYTYVENTKYYIQPIPATTSNKITLRGRLQTKNLTIADYATGSIVSIANGGTAVVGTGTTWTQEMVGSYIQITVTQAANGGDGFWYEVATVTGATGLTLVKPYEGTAIAAGTAAYTLGQVPPIPAAYQPGIEWRAAAVWWQNNNDLTRAKDYWLQYDGGMEKGFSKEYGGLMLQMLNNEGETEEGAYIDPTMRRNVGDAPYPPYYYPWQDASGF